MKQLRKLLLLPGPAEHRCRQLLVDCKGRRPAAEGNLGGLCCTTGQLHSRQRAGEDGQDVNPTGRMEIADQIFVGTHVDRTLPAKAGISHAQKGGGNVAPGDATHEQRGHEGGNVLYHATADRGNAGRAAQARLLHDHKQRHCLLQGLGLFCGLDPDHRKASR